MKLVLFSILSVIFSTLYLFFPFPIFIVLFFSISIGSLAWDFYSLIKRLEKCEKNIKSQVEDIKTLHKNQTVIVSSIKDIQKVLRRYDKELKVRVNARIEETGTEKI